MIYRIIRSLMRRFTSFYWRLRLKSCGNNTHFDLNLSIYNPLDISLGKNCSINDGVLLQSCEGARIYIGDKVTLSYRCMVLTGGLALTAKTDQKVHNVNDVIIKDNVWVGANSIILPGITLHKGCVIAAGSVVTKDVDENTIVAGNPAKFLKFKSET